MLKVSFDLDSYKTRFLGGAKQYLFYVLLNTPMMGTFNNPDSVVGKLFSSFGYGSDSDFLPYLVRSTTLPDSSFEEIQIPYPGHTFKMAGTRAYGDWQVSFNVDDGGRILKIFNQWHNIMYHPANQEYSSPESYMLDQTLFLVDGNGEAIRQYKLFGAWPKSISATTLDYASTDIATVDVVFSYQYYLTSEPTDVSKGVNSLIKTALNKLTGSAVGLPRF
jgi:hypothetical protein